MFCPKCGKLVADGALFCPVCGTKVNAASTAPETEVLNEPPKASFPQWQAAPVYAAPVYSQKRKTVASCSWFAAVSSVVLLVFRWLENRFYFPFGFGSLDYSLSGAVIKVAEICIAEVLYCLLCLAMFYAATTKIESDIRKKARWTAFIPVFFGVFFKYTRFWFNNYCYNCVEWNVVDYDFYYAMMEWVFPITRAVLSIALSWIFAFVALKRFDEGRVR